MRIFDKAKDFIDRIRNKKKEHDLSNAFRVLDTPYIDKSLKEISKKRWYIKSRIRVKNLYLIVLTDRASEPLEIICERDIYKPMHPKYDYTVVGIANDRDTAFEITRDIYQDIYDKQGRSIDVFKYFEMFDEVSFGGKA